MPLRFALCALIAALALAACDPVPTGPTQVAVLGGSVHVAAPPGYCIDTDATRAAADAAVVLIGRCTATGTVSAALLTVTIGRPASGGVMTAAPQALANFFASAAGRAALARDGVADHVLVQETVATPDTLLLHLTDITAGDYWRAIAALNGRLVTISASGALGAPLTPEQGRRLVEATLRALHKANPPQTG
jgi:hypothetical protein